MTYRVINTRLRLAIGHDHATQAKAVSSMLLLTAAARQAGTFDRFIIKDIK